MTGREAITAIVASAVLKSQGFFPSLTEKSPILLRPVNQRRLSREPINGGVHSCKGLQNLHLHEFQALLTINANRLLFWRPPIKKKNGEICDSLSRFTVENL